MYTETRLDPAVVGLLGNLRVPALIGTANEVKLLDGYDIVRGSSPVEDNKVDETVGPFSGTDKIFITSNLPIVTGDGTGTITNNINDIIVKVNGVQVVVAKVVGLDGKVILALPPKAADIVTCTYYYKRTDTKVVDEVVTDQADGTNKVFYSHHAPIVDGSNAGRTTTNVRDITVKVNGVMVDVVFLDGTTGAFTLDAAPIGTDTVTVTYWFNSWANTGDDLPQLGMTRMVRVGLSPETSDFVQDVDFAIIGQQIQWGTGYKVVVKDHTTGCEFFDDNQIQALAIDDRIYGENVSSQFTGTERTATVRFKAIVDGTGRDITTNDPSLVIVTVNGTVVDVLRVDGENGKVYLKNAPAGGSTVLVTYYRSRMVDDTYTLEVVVPGVTGVGTYKITSMESGTIGAATPGTWTGTVADVGYTGPDFLSGPMTTKGYSIVETVTVTFTSATQFLVSSSVPVTGSSGAGVLDSTYIDAKTGLIFTLASDPSYNYAGGDTGVINVTNDATFVTSVIPVLSVHGLTVTVDNTTDTCVNDTADLYTFNKSGKEPAVGEVYYMSYEYLKTDYECKLFTKFKDITNEYGDLDASNPLVLASYLMFQNGSIALINCQVKKSTGAETAADQSYFDVLDRLKYPVSGINPSVPFPVTTSQSVIQYVSAHCNTMSSKRMRKERTSVFGFAVGTEPNEASSFAEGINSERMVAIYPDGAVITMVDAEGRAVDSVVDGSFLAAAFVGLNVSTAYDVATPMTRKVVVGFKQLVREMDEATMDMVAIKGVTIIAQIPGSMFIRHCLTTRMESTFTREYNVTTIRDYIQQEARRVLDPFIGKKMLVGRTGDIQRTLQAMLRAAVEAELIVDFKGVSATQDTDQPDYVKVEASYIPVVGLNWISVTFNVRTKL